MRIRKRPPVQIPADPSPPSRASNGREEAKEERGGGGGSSLHPDGDLPVDPNGWWSRRAPTLTGVVEDPPPSDPHPTIPVTSPPPSRLNGCCIPSPHATNLQVLKEDEKVGVDLHQTWSAHIDIDMRNGGSTGAQVSGGPVVGEAAKARRGGYGIGDGKPVGKPRGRAKVNDVGAQVETGGEGEGSGKKRRSPGTLMEGSRCSRVNGRGWRCFQQTLVGYSLCEHHLGKGRLRSVSGMRGQASGRKPNNGSMASLRPPPPEPEKKQELEGYSTVDNGEEEEEEEEEEEAKEKKPAKTRRKKIGIVKARSMTSLLNESNQY